MSRSNILLTAGIAAALVACDDRETAKQEPAPEIQAANPDAPRDEATPRQGVTPGTDMAPDQGAAREARDDTIGTNEEAADASDAAEAAQLVKESAATLRQMKADPKLKGLLGKARGVLLVPTYGRGGAGIGARGGEGVLVARQNGQWSSPAFYDIGGISLGAQLGGEGGRIAMLLMSKQALDSFKEDDTFSLEAGAKFTIADYSKLAEETSIGEGQDVILWSDTEGAFAGATLGATNISWDDDENPAYYGKPITPADVLGGKATAPTKGELHKELSGV